MATFQDRARAAQENGAIFEALRTMSASYLRADTTAICDCIQAFCLNDLLFSIARLERLFKQRSCNGAPGITPCIMRCGKVCACSAQAAQAGAALRCTGRNRPQRS